MTRPTKREIEDRVGEMESTTGGVAARADELLAAKALGDLSEAEREEWRRLDTDVKERAVSRMHGELFAGVKAGHNGGEAR